MPSVEVQVKLCSPIQKVWDLLQDLSNYPRLMEPVRCIEVLEDSTDWTLAEWEIELKGSILKWVEREEKFPEQYKITFKQVSGDLEQFEGYWKLESITQEITLASLYITFEIGIQMLREMLDPVAEKALRENARKMLLSLAPAFETSIIE